MWSSDDKVHCKGGAQCQLNLIRFAPLASRWHDDEEIDVAIDLGIAIREGAEQDDLVGPKLSSNGVGVTPDHAHGNIGGPVIPQRRERKLVSRGFGHNTILTCT